MTVTATEALDRPITHKVRVSREEIEELNIIRRDLDVDKFILDLARFKKYSIDIRASVTAADVELTIDGAHQLTLSVRDTQRRIHRSGILDYAVDMNVEGWWWRLIRRKKDGDDLTLVFEPRVVAYLRHQTERIKARRGQITRAEFILRLIRAVKKTKIKFFCPELHKRQPIAQSGDRDEGARRERREPGLESDFTIQIDGREATSKQMENLDRVLTVGDRKGARTKVQIATMMCVLQESRAKTSATNGSHVGLFQQDPRYWPATRDPESDAEAWYDSVIKSDKQNPRQSLIGLIESVQRSGQGQYYAQWREEAENIVANFSSGEGGKSRERKIPYEFRVKKGENYWTTILRLADEVGWRAFTIRNKMYYISEEDLFKSKSLMTLKEGRNGVDLIDYDDDGRRNVTEVTITCRMKMWDAPLGSTVTVKDDGPADGKYLVTALRRSYFSQSGTITLRKPMKEKSEPPNETRTIESNDPNYSDIRGTARERVVEIAKSTMTSVTGFRRYSQPGALTADPTPPAPARTDCSQWIRAIYLKAGLPDPGTNTWEQARNGRRTRRPKPGDLMFPTSLGHVELYIGKGKTIGHGSPPIDFATVAYWPSHFFVTFDFLDDEAPKRPGVRGPSYPYAPQTRREDF